MSQRMTRYKTAQRPNPQLGFILYIILLELNSVNKWKDTLVLSQNVQQADIMSSKHIIPRSHCGFNIFTGPEYKKGHCIPGTLQCHSKVIVLLPVYRHSILCFLLQWKYKMHLEKPSEPNRIQRPLRFILHLFARDYGGQN